jgi:alkylhydroperoxidase family enzyme
MLAEWLVTVDGYYAQGNLPPVPDKCHHGTHPICRSGDASRSFQEPAPAAKFPTRVREQSQGLRELALLQVGHVTKSAYEFTHHVKVALAAGLTPQQIAAIPDANAGRPTGFSPIELSVLKIAAAVTAGEAVDDETFDFLAATLGSEHLMDLLFVTAHYLGMARLLTTLRIDLEDEYRAYLADFPLE